MTIFGSINTAVEALNAFSVKIGNISDNVANASTTGYKTVDTQFSDLVATRFQGSPVLNATRQGGVTAASTFANRSEEHTSELQSLMRISYAVSCLNKKK